MTTNKQIDDVLNNLVTSDVTAKSQDPIDQVADELRIATRIKRYAEARHKHAVASVTTVLGADKIDAVKELATKNKFKTEKTFSGAHMTVLVSCNAPAIRMDTAAFVNELVKAGVKKDLVDKCMEKAAKASAPATSITAVET